jgi:hypothetical protein
MKGYRERAMSTDNDEISSPSKTSSLFSPTSSHKKHYDYDGYNNGWDNPDSYRYNLTNFNIITILMNFKYEDIGITKEEDDETKLANAETKAIEAAYDRLEELLGKNYESKYQLSFQAVDEYDSYLVTITLTPVK